MLIDPDKEIKLNLRFIVLKNKINSLFTKIRQRFNFYDTTMLRLASLENQAIENAELYNNVHEIENKINYLNSYKKEIETAIALEKKLRIRYVQDSVKKIVEKIEKLENKVNELDQKADSFLYIDDTLENLNDLKLELVNELKSAKKCSDQYDFILHIAEEAEKKYELFLINLKRDISEFNMTHQVTRRLASVEKRITLLEMKPHGSGESISGTTRTNQD